MFVRLSHHKNFLEKLFRFGSRRLSTLFQSAIVGLMLVSAAGAAPSVSLNKTSFTTGEPVTVTVNGGYSNVEEWIALYVDSNPDSAWSFEGKWQFLNGQQSAPTTPVPYPVTLSFIAPSTPGTYNIRYFAYSGYSNRLAISQSFAVTTAAAPEITSSACTHYASPGGTGNGLSTSSPFKIAAFWPVAKPGLTLCLMDGQYTDAASMINPPQNLRGTSAAPITVRALNDGKTTINGQGSYLPVLLKYNDYFVLEGFNAHASAGNVVSLSNSHHNIIRRVAAWDALDRNNYVFGISFSSNNLLEDVAGWGIGRKIFSASQGGDFTTIRRAWGRWEGSHVVGPKMTYDVAYNNYNMLVENSLGTWSGERMKETYTLLAYDGTPWTGNGAGTYTNYGVNQPYGIFATSGFSNGDRNPNSQFIGNLAYVRGADRFAPSQAVYMTSLDYLQLHQFAAYIEPGSYTGRYTFRLDGVSGATATSLYASHLTGIGGLGAKISSQWKTSSIVQEPSLSSVANVFDSYSGANLCFQYQDGVQTNLPLWPWPMNQRIIDATIQSGRAAVDVTATVESMLGPIPSLCSSESLPPPPPPPSPEDTTPPMIQSVSIQIDRRWLRASVSASDEQTGVSKVEIYIDGNLKGTDSSSPFTFTKSLRKGTHTVQVKAYDGAGNSTMSAPATLTLK
jgi:hypothetical protein